MNATERRRLIEALLAKAESSEYPDEAQAFRDKAAALEKDAEPEPPKSPEPEVRYIEGVMNLYGRAVPYRVRVEKK